MTGTPEGAPVVMGDPEAPVQRRAGNAPAVPGWALLPLAVLTGVMVALALPPFDVEWLAWFAIAPLLVAGQGRRPLEAFGL